MKKSHLAGAMLTASLLAAPLSLQAQGLNLAPLVPAELVTSITQLGVEQLLPVAGNLLTGSGLLEPLLGNVGLIGPVTDLILGGDSLKGLSNFYGPVDMLLGPLVGLTAADGFGSLLASPLELLIVPVNPLLVTLGGGAQPLNGLAGLLDPVLVLLNPTTLPF